MALNLDSKKQVVADVAQAAAQATSAIAADYRGLPVVAMTRLRKQAREQGVYLRVVKNTLARRALADTPFACMEREFGGPLLLAFSYDDLGAAARLIQDFRKDGDLPAVKILAFDGTLQDPSQVERLATLPSREQALAMLMVVLKAPLENLARVLAAPVSKLARTLAAVRDDRQKSA